MAEGPESSDDELQAETNKRRITRPLPRRARESTLTAQDFLSFGKAPAPKKPRLSDVPLHAPQAMYDQVPARSRYFLRANSAVKEEELSDDGWL